MLITHTHSDHIAGLDDLRPYFFVKRQKLPLYATAHDLDALRTRFDYLFIKAAIRQAISNQF